jgi:hypothetical protein
MSNIISVADIYSKPSSSASILACVVLPAAVNPAKATVVDH